MTIDVKTLIPVVNKRSQGYSAVLRSGDYYEWLPSSDGYEDMIELPFRDVQYLHTTSATFKRGYLYIDDAEARKRLGLEKEEVKLNLVSREDIEKALKGNIAQLKKLLDTVKNSENIALSREVYTIAKEIKVDNITKLQLIAEATNIPMEVLIDENRK